MILIRDAPCHAVSRSWFAIGLQTDESGLPQKNGHMSANDPKRR